MVEYSALRISCLERCPQVGELRCKSAELHSSLQSSKACMRGDQLHDLGERESSQTPPYRRLCSSTSSEFTTHCRLYPSMDTLGVNAGTLQEMS